MLPPPLLSHRQLKDKEGKQPLWLKAKRHGPSDGPGFTSEPQNTSPRAKQYSTVGGEKGLVG